MKPIRSRSHWAACLLWLCTSACGSKSTQTKSQPSADAAAAHSGSHPAVDSKRDASTAPVTRDAALPASADSGSTPKAADAGNATTPLHGVDCNKRALSGAAGVHFHHVHFNTTDPNADLEFYAKYLGAKTEEFCKDAQGNGATRATRTERGYFLYTKVDIAPDPRLNTYLEHIGWIHPDPNAELRRLVQLGAPLYPVGRAQCESAFAGQMACNNYWFYLQAPSGARVEIAKGPGPATMGFGHVHMIMGVDYMFFEKATGGAFRNKAIDLVNHTDAALNESILDSETVVETRGKPIDHLGYSTTDLDAEKARVLAAGLSLAEDISWKPEYGFRSFFMKSEKGVWIEMVEDAAFAAGS